MNCYFCKQTFLHVEVDDVINRCCNYCVKDYNLDSVVTSYEVDYGDKTIFYHRRTDVMVRAHIYYDIYHVRLHLDDNHTVIHEVRTPILTRETPLVKLPGFPITPANIKEKLKLYLLFS